jgi:HEAT repeat protein
MMIRKKMLLFVMTFVLVVAYVASVHAAGIDGLIEQLRTGTRVQRERAAEDLIYDYGTKAIPRLIQELDSDDDAFRADIAFTLACMDTWYWELLSGRNLERAVDRLGDALSDSYWRVRANAAFALRQIGEAAVESEQELADALRDEDPRVRSAAAYGFTVIKGKSEKTIQALVECLSDEDRDTRWAAVCALGSIGSDAGFVVDQILICLEDISKWVRLAAVEALVSIGDSSDKVLKAVFETINKEDERNKGSMQEYYEESVVWSMMDAFIRFRDAVIPYLKTIFIDGRHRDTISYVFVEIGKPAIPVLLEIITECRDFEGKEAAVRSLAQIGDAAISELEKLAEDKDPEVREIVALGFKSLYYPDRRIISILCELVKDDDKWVRVAATESIATFARDTDAVDLVATGLTDASADSFSDVRYQAALGWRYMKEPGGGIDSVSPLVVLAKDTNVKVRKVAIQGLEEQVRFRFSPLSDRQKAYIVSVIMQNLSDSDNEVRLAALNTMGALIDEGMVDDFTSVVNILMEMMETKSLADTVVRVLTKMGEAAHPALERIMDMMWNTDNMDYQIAVAKIGGTDILPQMIVTLEHNNSSYRLNAVKVLYYMGPDAKSAIPALRKLVERETVYSVKFFAENIALPYLESGVSLW